MSAPGIATSSEELRVIGLVVDALTAHDRYYAHPDALGLGPLFAEWRDADRAARRAVREYRDALRAGAVT